MEGADDCNGLDASVHPGAQEQPYDGVDQDCDGADLVDVDGDGVPAPEDCNDEDPSVWPGVPETCNERDDDCDALVDEEPWDGLAVYVDGDGDGYGSEGRSTCALTEGFSLDGGDCDDGDSTINPAAPEACDGVDNNCDDLVDWMVAGRTHPTVQGAIDGACDGAARVWVPAGRWNENLWVSDSLYIAGEATSTTILDGSSCTRGADACHVVETAGSPTVSIVGLTLTGGLAEYGGGVLSAGANLSFVDVRIEDNAADHGGGAWLSGDVVMIRTTVADNTALQGFGGGIGIAGGGGGSFEATDCEVLSNTSAFAGGGLALGAYSEDSDIQNNVFDGNTAAEAGGGVYIGNGAAVVLRDNVISDNGSGSAPGGGGVACMDAAGRPRVFGGNTLSGNSPDDWWPSLADCE